MKKFLNLCLALCLLCGLNGVHSVSAEEGQTGDDEIIKCDEQGIPDPALYAAVLNAGDSNKDGILTKAEAEGIESLYANDDEIANLQGIEKLINLTNLSLSSKNITDLKEIENLTKLTSLSLSGKGITSLQSIDNLTNLTDLSLRETGITSLKGIENLINLTDLNLNYTNIKSINGIENLIQLNKLNLGGTAITELQGIENLTNLTYLSLSWTSIKNLKGIENLINLTNLSLSGTQINNLAGIENLVNLTVLTFDNTKVNDIKGIECLSNLTALNAAWTPITNLKGIENLINLTTLHINGTHISSLKGIENLSNLTSLVLDFTDITNLEDLVNLTELNQLSVENNDISELPDLTRLINLDKNYTSFKGSKITEKELNEKLPVHLTSDKDWIDENKYVELDDSMEPSIPKHEEYINSEKIPTDTSDRLHDDKVLGMTINMPNSDTATADIFQALKETGKNLTFNVKGENDRTKYSWTFKGNDIKNPDMDLDLSINFETEKQQEIQSITNQSNMFYVSFVHHGELPGTAKIKVDVSDKFKDGDYIYLYYYNEEKGTIERKGRGYEVKDGYAEFEINHCSVYFFTKEPVTVPVNKDDKTNTKEPVKTDSKKDGNMIKNTATDGSQSNASAIVLAVMVLGLLGFVVIKNKATE